MLLQDQVCGFVRRVIFSSVACSLAKLHGPMRHDISVISAHTKRFLLLAPHPRERTIGLMRCRIRFHRNLVVATE